MNPAWVVRYFYVLGWAFGVAFGTALVRAYVSGGVWWIFPPILLAAGVVLPFLRVRSRGRDKAEVR